MPFFSIVAISASATGVAAFVDEVGQRRIVARALLRQRVARGDRHVRWRHEGVGTGGVNRQLLFAVRHVEGDFHAFGAANPDCAAWFHLLRPAFQRVQIVQQLIGVSGDFDEPLRISLRSTLVSQRQQQPSITCSLASTVRSCGHQFTAEVFL